MRTKQARTDHVTVLWFIVPPTGCNQSCVKCKTVGERAAAQWAQTGSETLQHSQLLLKMTLFAARLRLGYRGVWAWCVAAQRVCFFSTLLWPNDRFYAWQTDWLQRFRVCWETRAVNKKVHLHWGSQTEERLIFFTSDMSSFSGGTLNTEPH